MQAAAGPSFPQIDRAPLNRRQRGLLVAAVLGTMMEFFDFFIIAYVLNIIAKPWSLSAAQSGFLLISAGVASIVGAIAFGALADRIGRRHVFQITLLTYALATGAMAAVPEGNWLLLGALRFLVGLGVGGLVVVDVPLVQEFVPSSKRGQLGGLVVMFIPVGSILGSLSAAFLAPYIGWRGLVLLGLLPAVLSLYVRFSVKESPTWLLSRGRVAEARESVAWVLGISEADVELPPSAPPRAAGTWRHMLRYRRSVAFTWLNSLALQFPFYGIILWGPALVSILLGLEPAAAARLMIVVNVCGFAGRILAGRLSEALGRRRTGMLFMGMAAALLASTALLHDRTVLGVSAFFLGLAASWFFLDGSFVVALPYWAELFPTEVRSTGTGSAYGIGGLGKVFGPAVLVVISGAGTAITPAATNSAVLPTFLLFAVVTFVGMLTYAFLGIETRGLSIAELDALLNRQRVGPQEEPGPANPTVPAHATKDGRA